MNVRLTIALVVLAPAVFAEELPRKTNAPRESYPNVDVIYNSVTAPDGNRLRTIITKPRDGKGKLPVIFAAGWLRCDSVEAPAGTKDESGLVFRGLAQLHEFALFRMDKHGVGDSEGVCTEADFDSELAGYRAAFRALKNYDLGLREQEWRSRVFLRNPKHGPHLSALFESGRRIQGEERAVRSKSDRTVSRLVA